MELAKTHELPESKPEKLHVPDFFKEMPKGDGNPDIPVAKVDNIEEIKDGGSYKDVKKHSDGKTHEVHHIPSDEASPIKTSDGPAIKMEKEDHQKTASWGNSLEAREYRAAQKDLIDAGDFRGALQMDIDDIKDKFGNKYDKAIEQCLAYVDKLEKDGGF